MPSGISRASAFAGPWFAGYDEVAIPMPTSIPLRVRERGTNGRFSQPKRFAAIW